MEKKFLTAYLRTQTGKGAARKLRRQGLIPAVLYGRGTGPHHLSLHPRQLRKALGDEQTATSVLLTLQVEGNEDLDNKLVILKEVQQDPVRHELLHVDLQEVFLDEKITATVPIHFTGKAAGTEAGGILQASLRSVEVECFPSQIPEFIEVNVAPLGIGDSLHISDLTLPEGVAAAQSPELLVVTVVPPRVEEVVAPAPEEVAAPEGEKPEPAKEESGE